MKIHRLKTLPDFFEALLSGDKNFEVRENDRGFQKGDILELERYDPNLAELNPAVLKFEITFVLSGWGLKNGHVALGLKGEDG